MRTGVGLAAALATACLAGCGPAEDSGGRAAGESGADAEIRIGAALDRAMEAIEARAVEVDDRLRPIALLRPDESSSLRTYLNSSHLARARSLGARPDGEDGVEPLVESGRLVPLADSTERWIVRELDHSLPYVTPDAHALLERVADRFHARLDSLDVPRYRVEVTSVLRTPEQQADLRAGNVNATGGTSAHEFGTTLDLAYSGFAAPSEPLVEPELSDAPGLARQVRRVADGMAELVAARRSRELQAILGRVLREMQSEGLVYVTLERRQPVYHVTVADRLAEPRADGRRGDVARPGQAAP